MSGDSCRSCGAVLADTDRFCPACGTPHSQGKFHPRLPRESLDREAYQPVEVAADEQPCRRCGRGVRPDEPFCRTCGFQLVEEDPWRAEGERLALVPRRPEFHHLGFLTVAVRWVLRCVAVASVIAAGLSFAIMTTARGLRQRTDGDALNQLHDLRDLRTVVVSALAGLGLLSVFVVIPWLRRALSNMPALGATPRGLGPGAVIPGMIIPLVNLVVPVVLLTEAWRGSDPDRAVISDGAWRRGWVPATLWIAWGLFVTFALMLALGASWDPSDDVFANDQFAATLDAVAFSVLAVSIIVLHMLVEPLADRQEARAQQLGIRLDVDADDDAADAPEPAEPPAFHDGETWGVY